MNGYQEQLNRIVELYVDDMVIKYKRVSDNLANLQEVFDILWAHCIKLNLTKCGFEVLGCKFLGYIVF